MITRDVRHVENILITIFQLVMNVKQLFVIHVKSSVIHVINVMTTINYQTIVNFA